MLSTFVDALGPSSPAVHIAVQVLRVNLQPAFTHIFRACSWSFVYAWAGMLQTDVTAWLSQTLSAPLVGPASQLILAMPLRFAGLGLLNFQYEAALHSLHGALALGVSKALTLSNSETWSGEVSHTIGFVERTANIDVEQLLATRPPLKQGRGVTKCIL